MRGRVMAMFLAIALGGSTIGAPIVGGVADHFGPRWALGVGGVATLCAALVGLRYLVKYRGLRLHVDAGRFSFSIDGGELDGRNAVIGV